MRFVPTSLMLSDSYKVTHYPQYEEGTEFVYSYFEARNNPYFKEVVFFGLQYILETISGKFFNEYDLLRAEKLCLGHFGKPYFNKSGWRYILDKYDGKLPIRIKAVPEGTVVPTGNCLMTIKNTDPKCYWLTNWLESLLLEIWYPCVVATQSREMKKQILHFLNLTGTPGDIKYKLHDFGFRGVSSVETAAIGGAAHLVNFRGTDTLTAIDFIDQFYAKNSYDVYGESIAASEHSTITSWGEENELAALKNMLDKYPTGAIACVSDSFDIYRACRDYWGGALRDQIMARDGVLVIRPDSGDPGPVIVKILEILSERFPWHTNSKGYKVLDEHIRLIQGDGIGFDTLYGIMQYIVDHGWSIDNIAFGSGGGLLQKVHRDMIGAAIKNSSISIRSNGYGVAVERDVYKRPITDGGKRSKSGRFKLIKTDEGYKTVPENRFGVDELITVYENGEILFRHNFDDIRNRAEIRS